jgi:hypothetical protein
MVTHRHIPSRRKAIRGGCGKNFPVFHASVYAYARPILESLQLRGISVLDLA